MWQHFKPSVVNGGCSDDGFEYFRGWLIGQGGAYFEAALKDPERAADNVCKMAEKLHFAATGERVVLR